MDLASLLGKDMIRISDVHKKKLRICQQQDPSIGIYANQNR